MNNNLKKAAKHKKSKPPEEKYTGYGTLKNCGFILKQTWKHTPALIFIIIIHAIVSAMITIMDAITIKLVLDVIIGAINDNSQDISQLLITTAIITAILIFLNAINCAVDRNFWRFVLLRMKIINMRIAKALRMNYQNLENPEILDLHNKAINASSSNNNGIEGLLHNIDSFACGVAKAIASMAIILTLNPLLVLIMTTLCVVQYFFFVHTVKRDREEYWNKCNPVQRRAGYINNISGDFSYAKDIRLYSTKNWIIDSFKKVNLESFRLFSFSRNLWAKNSVVSHTVSLFQEAILYIWVIAEFIINAMTVGNLSMYLGGVRSFTTTLNEILQLVGTMKQNSMQVDDFRRFIELDDGMETNKKVPRSGSYTFEFKDVSFKYSGQEVYALKNLNLKITAGQKLAVVGLNGAGKSTFIKLLMRIYDVTEGCILLNGVDVREYNREDYFNLFSPVFQDIHLFAFPLSQNISMSPPEQTDKKTVEKCIADAGLKAKVDELPHGIETEMLKVKVDDGVDFSGGEKQKLALARALYKNADIVVLDEPTAALDALAEYNLYQNFNSMIGKKSAIYISHRLSSTRFCDEIAMFMNGEMVEYGNHEELLAKGGEYAKMFNVQAQYYKDSEEVNFSA